MSFVLHGVCVIENETSPSITEPSLPPLCVLIGPFPLGPSTGTDKPGPAAEGLPEPSAPRTDTHPWP